MRTKLKPLSEQVIVITGATSGIGLVTAREAAKRGARLVLVARNEAALSELVDELTQKGCEAIHVTADVGIEADITRVADVAIDHFGGFDTWVSNAGVSIYGPLEAPSTEEYRRLFDTNFWGVVFSSLTARKHLRQHGGGDHCDRQRRVRIRDSRSGHVLGIQTCYQGVHRRFSP
jgi:NAD(P)-dependent dehydrogenase (short-subunit alcohol dehydrogenase family)